MGPQTAEMRRRHINEAMATLIPAGWAHEYLCVFKSPSGNIHDMSAADIRKHKQIDKQRLFMVLRRAEREEVA